MTWCVQRFNEVTVGVIVRTLQANPSFIPTLEIYNAKEKPMSIDRDGQAVIVNPSSSRQLKSGDKVNIVVGISVECVLSTLNWILHL